MWHDNITSILKVKSKLPSGVYINKDLPGELVECRKLLRPVMKEVLKLEHYRGKVKLQQGRLVINNESYSVDALHELPKNIVAELSFQKVSDKTIAFFGPHLLYSNMYQSPFVADNVYYRSSEHYIQAKNLMFESTAMGHDGISNVLVKNFYTIRYPLCIISNKSFIEGIYPDLFKLAKVIPLHSAGKKMMFTIIGLFHYCLLCQRYYKNYCLND